MAMSETQIAFAIDELEKHLLLQQALLSLDDELSARAEHIGTMYPRLREMLGLPDKREKIMRWLGFLQGAYYWAKLASLEDLKRMNMPPEATYDPLRDAAKGKG